MYDSLFIIVIDLGPLQGATIIDITGFGFGIKFVDFPATFAVPVAGAFKATKWHVALGTNGRTIDVGNTAFDVAHCFISTVYIAGVNAGTEAVVGVIKNIDGFFKTFNR
jgi:hypothetical protein